MTEITRLVDALIAGVQAQAEVRLILAKTNNAEAITLAKKQAIDSAFFKFIDIKKLSPGQACEGIHAFLARGVNPCNTNSKRCDPLSHAAAINNVAMIEGFKSITGVRGAELNFSSALITAVNYRNLGAVQALLKDERTDVNAPGNFGETPCAALGRALTVNDYYRTYPDYHIVKALLSHPAIELTAEMAARIDSVPIYKKNRGKSAPINPEEKREIRELAKTRVVVSPTATHQYKARASSGR